MLKQTLADSWNFFVEHWKVLFLIYLPISVLYILFDLIEIGAVGDRFYIVYSLVSLLMKLVGDTLFLGISAFYIASCVSGEKMSFAEILRRTREKFFNLLHLTINVFLFTSVGFILLIIPGVFVFIKMTFSGFELLFNNTSPVESMKKSWHQTNGYFSLLLGGLLLISVPVYFLYFLIYSMLPESEVTNLIAYIIYMLIDFVISALLVVFFFRIYYLYKADSRTASEA